MFWYRWQIKWDYKRIVGRDVSCMVRVLSSTQYSMEGKWRLQLVHHIAAELSNIF
jgi:hypothetical protein